MTRPVWLLSMDTDQFCAPPMTTGALAAYFAAGGRTAAETEVELVHFANRDAVERWLASDWPERVRPCAEAALAAGSEPVLAVSCYTWNVAEFLDVVRRVKNSVPGMLVVAGGPHVQRAEDFLHDDGIDVVVLGEGEETFAELLDCPSRACWSKVAGLAYLSPEGRVHRTPPRPRAADLDRFPSALDVVELRDRDGSPLYRQAAYETSRGCPYRCSFCEWGTGAIGTKMYQFSLDRIRHDLERLVAGGVHDIWFSDSNFGALREDLDKARIIVDLRRRTGRPNTFATSWSKNHNRRVQEIVRLLHREGLLWHYHLALQTLTPLALDLSHRTNMRANDYEPVVKALAAEGVPVTAELIWGLPGDNLGDFSANLDHLFSVFPNINIFAYTLLPGTEFFDKREEYRLVTLPVAGYGKAKGEYVVGCHTFPREEGEEGYVLVASHVMFSRGHVIPYTIRLLALDGRASVSALLRKVVRALMEEFAREIPAAARRGRMAVYEDRAALYLAFLSDNERMYACIRRIVEEHLAEAGAGDLWPEAAKVLALDRALCPRTGPSRTLHERFDFDAERVLAALGEMERPEPSAFEPGTGVDLEIRHPAEVGVVLVDPDGGSWMRGRVRSATRDGRRTPAPIPWLAEQGAGAAAGG
jgi:hypothetical protein